MSISSKRKFIITNFLLLIISSAGLLARDKSIAVNIRANYFAVYQNLSIPGNWHLWCRELKAARALVKPAGNAGEFSLTGPETAIHVKRIWLNNLQVCQQLAGKTSTFNCVLAPEPRTGNAVVIIAYRQSFWGGLFQTLFSAEPGIQLVSELKNYMENPDGYYGLDIHARIAEPDTFLVNRAMVSKNAVYASCKLMGKQLDDFIAERRLNTTSPFRLQFYQQGKGSIELLIGRRISKKVIVPDKFKYMVIPGGKLLAINFNGRYVDRLKLYARMQSYLSDRFLKQTMPPFEVFNDDKLPVSDTDAVKLQALFPYAKN
jgi:effector-binding domain-containing protein